jgi:hypothetical protein
MLHRSTIPAPAEPEVLPSWLEAPAATMELTLDAITEEWGTVRGYLESIGVSAEE